MLGIKGCKWVCIYVDEREEGRSYSESYFILPSMLVYASYLLYEFCFLVNSVSSLRFSDFLPVRESGFGEGNGLTIFLDDLTCSGAEDSLLECLGADSVGNSDCDHSEDAGVRCDGNACLYSFPVITIYLIQSTHTHAIN